MPFRKLTKKMIDADRFFLVVMGIIGGTYIFLIVAMLLADFSYTGFGDILQALKTPEIKYAIKLSLITCTVSMFLSVLVAIPIGYFMARTQFFLKDFLDAILDIPIILPPLVIGLSLLILFQTPLGKFFDITYTVYSIVLAQFMVACAFAVRTMYVTFQQINPRQEQVALTLGCNRFQSFFYVLLPQAKNGILTAAALAWARSLGEFGPILIFSGATRMRTEVLSTTVFLEMSVGNIEAAVAVSLIMIFAGFLMLILVRSLGKKSPKNE